MNRLLMISFLFWPLVFVLSCNLFNKKQKAETVVFSINKAKTGYIYVLLDKDVDHLKKDGSGINLEFSAEGAVWVNTFEMIHRKYLKVVSPDGLEHWIRRAGRNGSIIRFFIGKSKEEFEARQLSDDPDVGADTLFGELKDNGIPFKRAKGYSIKKP